MSSAVLVNQDSGCPNNIVTSPDLQSERGSDRDASVSEELTLISPLIVMRPVLTGGFFSFSSIRVLRKNERITLIYYAKLIRLEILLVQPVWGFANEKYINCVTIKHFTNLDKGHKLFQYPEKAGRKLDKAHQLLAWPKYNQNNRFERKRIFAALLPTRT